MANLTATFELIDRMSDRLDTIANSGTDAVEQWERAGEAADSAFNAAESGGQRVATACDGVASSVRGMSDAMEDSSGSAREQEQMFALCEQAAAALNDAIEASTSMQEELEAAMESAGGASKAAEEALRDLEAAQKAAADAMEHYDATLISGTDDLGELEAAAERAMHAAEDLAGANERASAATADLGAAANDAGDQFEDTGQKGVDAFTAIGNTLIGAAIAKTLKEAADAAYELVDAFSEAESTIVIATGATGSALDSLTASMNRVYAASKTGDLSQTAAAVGEINTRLGYTGEALEETTALFLDFAAVTDGQAASSVRNVTQLMNQWDIAANQLESTLDKLTYAGQVSGISVESLSSQLTANKSILDQLDFSLDQSIALFAQFELNGTHAASVMTGFRTALSSGVISSLEDLYDVFERISSGEMDAAGAADIFGARAGTTIVNAVKQGTFSLDGLVNALENTQGTTVATAEAAQTLGQQWEQASNNINAAFTSAIEPVTSKLSSGLASVMNGVGDFLNEHPMVTKAITAVGVGVGVAAVAIGGFVVVTKVAIPAITSFGAALNTALGPVGWLAMGITAVVAAGTALAAMTKSSISEYDSWTASTKAQYDALQDLNEEYEHAVEVYGETSDEARRLEQEIAGLEARFESSKKTMAELIAENDALIESHENTVNSLASARNGLDEEERTANALIGRLNALSSATELSSGQEQEFSAIIDKLNSQFPELNLHIDETTGKINLTAEAIQKVAQAQAEQNRYEREFDAYTKALEDRIAFENQLKAVNEELAIAVEASTGIWDSGNYQSIQKAASELMILSDEQQRLQEALDETNALIAEQQDKFDEYANAALEAANATVSYEDAVSRAISSVQEDIDALCESYDTAYESARSSIDGQIGLFDTMATATELSIADMQAAFDSQIEYLNTYTENLRRAAEYGLDEGLIASLSDGSQESAGYLNAIIENIEALGDSSAEAQAFVDDFNASFKEVEAAKDEFANTVATMETDFDEKMAEIEGRLDEAIDNMNMEADAAAAARETMEAYTRAILDGTTGAVSAAESAASAVAAALNRSGPTGTTVTVAGHADGTTSGEDVYVAGENGPELILDRRGSTVFPASETQKIINAVDDYRDDQYYHPPEYYAGGGEDITSSGSGRDVDGTKKIVLSLEGAGNIVVSGNGGADREQILDILQENMRPVLADIISAEIFEEGDGSYEY